MFKPKFWVIALWVLLSVQTSFAQDREKILGVWRLISYEAEFQATGEREPTMGKNPAGFIIFTPEGRAMYLLTGDGRKAPITDADRAALFKSMFAYTGLYRIEGDKWITKVDVAWNPDWVGSEQVRFFRLDGDRLQVISAWQPAVVKPERGMARGILTFDREK